MNFKAKLKYYIRKQDFHPSFLGIFTNPFYFARRGIQKNIKQFAPKLQGRCLDIGCGNKNYEHYYTHVVEYVGLEYDQERNKKKAADFFYDGNTFPFENSCFDSVVSNEVLEHVFNPTEHISEMHRVLKPGGMILLTLPFVWDEHEQPYDFARYSSFGLRHLLEQAGFEILEMKKSAGDITCIFQCLNMYIYKSTLRLRKSYFRNIITTLLLNAPFTLLGLALAKLLPSNEDLYLDNIVLAKKK